MVWTITRYPELALTESRRSVCITVWDSDRNPSGHPGLVYCWNGYRERDSVHSLLRYVELHSGTLRRKYLAWIHDLGEHRIDGKCLIDHLALEDGLSFWWMTRFVEQSPWKSPSIVDAIRLLALETIILEHRPCRLRLVSGSWGLNEAISEMCRNLGIAYEWVQPTHEREGRWTVLDLYRALPQPMQALISLARHVRIRRPLRRKERAGWFGDDRSVFVCSYFVHLDEEAAVKGEFHSRHWENLPGMLHDRGYAINWLQHYVPSGIVPNAKVARDWVQRINRNGAKRSFHSFLDAYLSWGVVFRVVRRWFGLNRLSWRLRGIRQAFRPLGSSFSLWPLMRADWYASLRGPGAISSLLWIELFDQALRDLPHQSKGLYLCENQAWERALIHAWRKHGHGQLIAVAHSTVRFWDLRYITDLRTVRSESAYPLPQPDLVALNGKVAIDAYRSADYPSKAIVECEALRYGYLNDLRARPASRRAKAPGLKVLILGDYSPANTIKMLELLEAAVPQMSAHVEFTVKSHPNYAVKFANYPSLHLQAVVDPLGQILHDFDIAYSSNVTSAALDAYLGGLPVVVMLDAAELNFSPLRGQPGVRFVSTPDELSEALRSPVEGLAGNHDPNEFFFLDPELPRWKRVLGVGDF